MPQAVTLRLPDETAEVVRPTARRERRSVNEVGARIMEEWVRQNRFSHIEFRTNGGERQACLKGRLEVWQVILVARSVDMDVEQTSAHLAISRAQAQAALNYFAAYPDEITAALSENDRNFDRLREILPSIELAETAASRQA